MTGNIDDNWIPSEQQIADLARPRGWRALVGWVLLIVGAVGVPATTILLSIWGAILLGVTGALIVFSGRAKNLGADSSLRVFDTVAFILIPLIGLFTSAGVSLAVIGVSHTSTGYHGFDRLSTTVLIGSVLIILIVRMFSKGIFPYDRDVKPRDGIRELHRIMPQASFGLFSDLKGVLTLSIAESKKEKQRTAPREVLVMTSSRSWIQLAISAVLLVLGLGVRVFLVKTEGSKVLAYVGCAILYLVLIVFAKGLWQLFCYNTMLGHLMRAQVLHARLLEQERADAAAAVRERNQEILAQQVTRLVAQQDLLLSRIVEPRASLFAVCLDRLSGHRRSRSDRTVIPRPQR